MKLSSSIVLTSRAVAGKSSIGRCLVVSNGVKTGDGRGWYFRPLLLFTGLMSEIRDLNINHLSWLTGSISSVIFLCCKVPGDYLNQWYFIVNETIMNNFIESFIFVEMEAFENNSTWCRILRLGLKVCCPHWLYISVLKSTDFVGKFELFHKFDVKARKLKYSIDTTQQ